MNAEEKRRAIAVWRGAKIHPRHDMQDRDGRRYFECSRCGAYQCWRDYSKDGELKGECVEDKNDYLNSLDAMHEAELKIFGTSAWNEYYRWLVCVFEEEEDSDMGVDHEQIIHATAAQKAEALLRTIYKWSDTYKML